MFGPSKQIRARLKVLEGHLQRENPLLVDVVKSFRQLDKVAYRLGLLTPEQSYAARIPWWPLVSILGTFSAGKSTFINHYLQQSLQATGTQAVDDRFTVICFSSEQASRTLPGIALDADPRFPFYQMSEALERVAAGEGKRIDAYLRLKTCPSEQLRGTILIDSPGFDADAQRTATLKITDYIIDLSDLVLVFFDARHPEPGAMQDTLTHLVGNTIGRRDSSKFLYILNQIDTTAREDNPEEVVGAWQRAIAQEGLTAGKFYCIYNPDAAIPIENDALRARFESKRDSDLGEIHDRIRQVGIERAYRIVDALEKSAREIDEELVPRLRELVYRWRRGVWVRDGILLAGVLLVLLLGSVAAGYWDGLDFTAPQWLSVFTGSATAQVASTVALIAALLGLHHVARRWSFAAVKRYLKRGTGPGELRDSLMAALVKNTRPWRSILRREPVGWNRGTRRRLQRIIDGADHHIQSLNDRFTDPSGESVAPLPAARSERAAPAAAVAELNVAVEPPAEDTRSEEVVERPPRAGFS